MIKVEIISWNDGKLYSAYAQVRTLSIETINYKSPAYAQRAFIAGMNRLGVDRTKYKFVKESSSLK